MDELALKNSLDFVAVNMADLRKAIGGRGTTENSGLDNNYF